MISHSFYESDNRVMRYAQALVGRGDSVDVIALRRQPGLPQQEVINGVRVHRVQDRFGKNERSTASFLWPLIRFVVVSSRLVNRLHKRKAFDVIHAHNMPDFVVFAGWYPKLRGAKVILDIHDIMPECFVSKFGDQQGIAMLAVRVAERISAAFADHVILASDLWLTKYTSRSAPGDKCTVFINYVDEQLFYPRERTSLGSKKVVLFPGGLHWHQGVDVGIRAFATLLSRLPAAEFHIYGDGNRKSELRGLVDELGLGERVRFFDPVSIGDMAEIMANADLGIVPKRANSFGNEAYSTKILEFMASGVPVVVSSTEVDRYYFNERVVHYFESEDCEQLANAMYDVLCNENVRRDLLKNASEYAAQHTWERRKKDYLSVIDELCAVDVEGSADVGTETRAH